MASTSRPKRRRGRPRKNAAEETNVIPAANIVAPPELDTYGIEFSSNEQVARFQNLCGRVISPTKFCNSQALHSLGISEGVKALFRKLEWHRFLGLRADTYRPLTLEFLSTLNADAVDGINFRMLNVDRHLSTNDLCTIFRSSNSGEYCPKDHIPLYFNDTKFWQAISARDEVFEPRHAKATMIRHPVMRLAHCILSSTICARQDAETITRYELYILWCMTDPEGIHAQYFPNGTKCILNEFFRAQESASGEICFGGLITLIATRPPLSLDLPTDWTSVGTANSLDITYLHTRMHMIEPITSRLDRFFWFIGPERHRITLPSSCAVIEEITPTTNWKFPDPDHPPTPPHLPRPEDRPLLVPDTHDFFGRFDALARDVRGLVTSVAYVRATQSRQQQTIDQILRYQQRLMQYHYDQGHFPPPP